MIKAKLESLFKSKSKITILSCDPSYSNYGIVLLEYNINTKKESILVHKTISFNNNDKNTFFLGKKVNLNKDKESKYAYDNFRLSCFYNELKKYSNLADVILVEGQSYKNVNETKTILQLVHGQTIDTKSINWSSKLYKEYQPSSWRKFAFGKGNLDKHASAEFIKELLKSHIELDNFDEHQLDALGVYLGFKGEFFE